MFQDTLQNFTNNNTETKTKRQNIARILLKTQQIAINLQQICKCKFMANLWQFCYNIVAISCYKFVANLKICNKFEIVTNCKFIANLLQIYGNFCGVAILQICHKIFGKFVTNLSQICKFARNLQPNLPEICHKIAYKIVTFFM